MSDFNLQEKTLELIKQYTLPCIFIHRPFPPPRKPTGRSKLGGLPTLPESIEWPMGKPPWPADSPQRPQQFLAQIDCSELPKIDDRLPTTGMLFFFADFGQDSWESEEADDYRRVIYVEHVPADQKVRQPPAGLPNITYRTPENFHDGFFDAYDPANPLTDKIYYEWPVEFIVADSYLDAGLLRETEEWFDLTNEWHETLGDDKHWDEADKDVSLAIHAHRGLMMNNVEAALCLEAATKPPSTSSKGWRKVAEMMQKPFPPNAEIACMMATQLALIANSNRVKHPDKYQALIDQRNVQPKAAWESAADEQKPKSKERGEIAAEWAAKFRSMPREQDLSEELREEFLAWYERTIQLPGFGDYDPFSQLIFHIAQHSASSPRFQPYISDEVFKMFAGSRGKIVRHQMLGYFRSSQSMPKYDEDILSLLMLEYDNCTGMHICDIGEMHMFIDESDLKNKNFERVEATMQG